MASDGDWTDSFTETSSSSWLERIQEALSGIIFGLALVVGMVWLLAYNEGRAAKTYAALTEGQRSVIAVPSDRVNHTHDNRLVHVSGTLKPLAPLNDKTFAVSEPAVRLIRHVSMYQWHEKEETRSEKHVGGSETRTKTYTYERRWSDKPVNSEKFKKRRSHENPAFKFQNQEQTAEEAQLDAYRPTAIALQKLKATKKLVLDDRHARAVASEGGRLIDGNTLYFGGDPASPQVGDMKVHFTVLPEGPATFVGRQNGAELLPYLASSGKKLLLATTGLKPVNEMFADARFENSVLTWVIRIAGLVLLWLGLFLILRPIAVIGDVVPLIGSIIGVGAGIIAFAGTAVIGGSTIAVAWFYHRPMVTGIVLAVSLSALLLLNRGKAAPPSAPTPTPPTTPRRRDGFAPTPQSAQRQSGLRQSTMRQSILGQASVGQSSQGQTSQGQPSSSQALFGQASADPRAPRQPTPRQPTSSQPTSRPPRRMTPRPA